MKRDLTNFARNLRILREASGLTQQQLAEKSGLRAEYIRMLESSPVYDDNKEKLAKALGVPKTALDAENPVAEVNRFNQALALDKHDLTSDERKRILLALSERRVISADRIIGVDEYSREIYEVKSWLPKLVSNESEQENLEELHKEVVLLPEPLDDCFWCSDGQLGPVTAGRRFCKKCGRMAPIDSESC